MIHPNQRLPLTAQKQLKKVTQASLIDERKQKVAEPEKETQNNPHDPPKKRRRKGLLDIYV
ncbi:hypothetical protein VV869_01240 [Photobacterium sp. MCCC 1A19761]|uniref:hypothetical protein n=1 Tax=unclassified Photobacterium TaxID=2628852 RepID=UPI0021BE47F1|nr:hypothetical protein [Photobacterium sp. TY1-4]UXI02124.1 hypothetical protein NH461_04915 [Photobacterium sp. TY1-4]